MGKLSWGWMGVLTLGWLSPASAQMTPAQRQLWWQPTLVHLSSGYQGQWRWQERTWTTVAMTQGTGVLVHPDGQILTLATVVQAAHQGEDVGKQLLLEDLAEQRLTLHNQAFPRRTIPLTPQNIREAAGYIQREAQLEQFVRFNQVVLAGGREDQSFGFKVKKFDSQTNLALVTVPLTQTPTLLLAPGNPPPTGTTTTIYALAQPAPAAPPTLYTGTWNPQGITFAAPQAMAGGMVFLANGDVLGLAAPQGNRVTLIPTATLNQFLRQAGVNNQDSPVNALWQQGLGHFWQAHYRRAQPVFQAILNRYPQHHGAQTLLTQAQERINRGEDRSPVAWWQIGLVGVGMVLVGGVGVAIWFSRRPRPVPPVQRIPTPPSLNHRPLPRPDGDVTAPVTPATLLPPETPTVPRMVTPPPVQPTEVYRPSRLVCLSGPAAGAEFALVGNQYLGRDSQRCQIVIPDPQISGQHASIEVDADRVILRDCGSTNGTFINDVRHPQITQVQLQDQDVIILGQKGTVKFRFHA